MARSIARSEDDHDRPATFSLQWAAPFLTIAHRTGSLVKAAEATEVTLAQVYNLRDEDPAFAAALRDVEVGRRALIVAQVEDAASQGNLKAIKLLLGERHALAALVDHGPKPGADGVPPSIEAAAVAAYWHERDRLRALLENREPFPTRRELEGAVVCPNCNLALGPWYAGDDVRADLTTYFAVVLADAWRYAKLMGRSPTYAEALPDPEPHESLLDFRHVPEMRPKP